MSVVTRRSPVQERSHETVARILAATSALLGRGVAAETLTTAQIAHEAGLSVGGLYRFFPDKQAIVDAIAARHMEAFQEEAGAALVADFPETPRAFLGFVIDRFVAYLDLHPDFRTLAFGAPGGLRAISSTSREAQAGAVVADLVLEFLEGAFDLQPSEELRFRLRIATEIGDRLLGFALEQGDPVERARVLAEMREIVGAYLFPEG